VVDFLVCLSGHSRYLSMEFVSVDTAKFCPWNFQRKVQWRAVAGFYQRCEIKMFSLLNRTV